MVATNSAEMVKKIEELKKKRDQYNAKLQNLEQKFKEKSRKDDVRKKILVGALVLDKLEKDGKFAEITQDFLTQSLNQFLTRKADRVLFALPALEGAEG